MKRWPFFSSLYGRIFALFWLTLLLVLMAVLAAQHSDPRSRHTLPEPTRQELGKVAQDLSRSLTGMPGSLSRKLRDIEKSQPSRGPVVLYFVTADGEPVNRSHHRSTRALRNFVTVSDDLDDPAQRLYGRWMMAGPFEVTDGRESAKMYAGRVWREAPPFFVQILDRPFQLLLVTMAVSTPLLLWLAWGLSKPARRMQAAAERVAQGKFESDPALEKGPLEFRKAGSSFNQMVSALNQMISGQQRLLSDISHELRSPLTRLRMANALAMRKQGESSALTRIDTEAERMESMIADLLSLSRMQTNSHTGRERVTCKALWQSVVDDAGFEAGQCGKNLVCGPLPEWMIEGNVNLLQSALENVVRNAVKYADSEVGVTFVRSERQLTVSVSDNGEGVPEAELDDIFRPFYRVSTARDRQSGGTGLGLAITDSAMRQHSGKAVAKASPSGGLTVVLSLPLCGT